MREIKFRAWTESDKSMTRPLDIGIPDEAEAIRYYGIGQKSGLSILEQFTGLHDKNGKEIYEGDIIQDSTFKDRGSYIMAVEWEKESASFVLTRNGWAFRHYFYESSNPDDCEVIGNIHENPELLA